MMNLVQQFASVLDSRSDQHVGDIVDGIDKVLVFVHFVIFLSLFFHYYLQIGWV